MSSELPIAAMILAGGLGTRLRSIVNDRPKPMAMIHGKPFLDILIRSLAKKGVRKFVLLTGYGAELIEDYFRTRPNQDVEITVSPEPAPLGTGGAVKNAEQFATDPSLLVNGDTFFDVDVGELFRFHVERRAKVTLSLHHVADVSRYGSVLVNDKGAVTGFREKEPKTGGPGLINAGLSLLAKDFIQSLPDGPFSMEVDVFPKLAGTGEMFALRQEGPFFDIGTPESYEAFRAFVKGQ
ncbi:MAG: nucleotidyltransferase family protein [Desulfomonile tiedjei]|nr:nucleotidyltransferase family protein [Desulfomonile tiedjei]